MRVLCTATAIIGAMIGLCGCGGSSGNNTQGDLEGTFRLVRIAPESGSETTCPGTITVGSGSSSIEVSCSGSDDVTFGSGGAFTSFSDDAEGLTRTRGTYTRSGDFLTVTFTDESFDENNNGTFESNEIDSSPSIPSQTFSIQEISSDQLRISVTIDGRSVFYTFNRLN